jgi:Ca-activated chloride channel family protein
VRFDAPLALLALAALPLLAIAYVRSGQRAGRAAAAFAAPALSPSVAPHGPGWRRHVPMAIFGVALAVLVVALARPERTVAVPVEQAQIMLLTDVSGSMLATDVTPSRLVAARRAAQQFVDDVPRRIKIGVMAFNQTPQVLQSPTTDRDALTGALSQLRSSGGTATGDAIAAAVKILQRAPASATTGRKPPAAIVLLSDGASERGVDPVVAAQAAARLKIPISTVALGTAQGTISVYRNGKSGPKITKSVPPDPATLRRVAQASGGTAYTAATTNSLSSVYKKLGSQLSHKKEPRQVTAGVAGAGLVLLLLGAGLSLRWFGRIV